MTTPPKWFLPVSVLALLWNLVGCAAYLHDAMLTPEAIAAMSPAEQAMYAARPSWFVAAYAVAVWFGALGSLGLVLRKRWARGVLLGSLLGVIVQDLGLARMGVEVEAGALGLQAAVLAIAIVLVLLARTAAAKEWLA